MPFCRPGLGPPRFLSTTKTGGSRSTCGERLSTVRVGRHEDRSNWDLFGGARGDYSRHERRKAIEKLSEHASEYGIKRARVPDRTAPSRTWPIAHASECYTRFPNSSLGDPLRPFQFLPPIPLGRASLFDSCAVRLPCLICRSATAAAQADGSSTRVGNSSSTPNRPRGGAHLSSRAEEEAQRGRYPSPALAFASGSFSHCSRTLRQTRLPTDHAATDHRLDSPFPAFFLAFAKSSVQPTPASGCRLPSRRPSSVRRTAGRSRHGLCSVLPVGLR